MIKLLPKKVKPRIGVVITSSPSNGGTYHYSISVLRSLAQFGPAQDYIVFYNSDDADLSSVYNKPNWTLVKYKKERNLILVKFARFLSLFLRSKTLLQIAAGRHSVIGNYDLDLLILPSTSLAGYWCQVPNVVAIHDIWHRRKLPGSSILSEPFRDLCWKVAAQSTNLILTESEYGKEEISAAYKVSPNKIFVLPTGPAPFVWSSPTNHDPTLRSKYDLPCEYVFYPGGLSMAKNQVRVVQSIAILKSKYGIELGAVFTGSLNTRYWRKFNDAVLESGMQEHIRVLGPVDDQDMKSLYLNAVCLTMASYIGPTNMPIWEAFAVGCPVVSSNVGGMPDQVGHAGLLFNPDDADELADQIYKIYSDQDLARHFIEEGRKHVEPLKRQCWANSLRRSLHESFNDIYSS